ncbi:ANTAR domain-containing response regulator [Paenibacillus crassostreae]|uniref:Histidine kinase n=1 Tax=Paenibacillus crassostreae TaxID=1763538 RepID=A0A162KN19_9BACL|nr:GAF and ANTAR domain-containing protein [Paenibacillus crassostreae]AOZ92398.1 hypothetical protein LPB68_09245 [Paenibacillus crassostreae]OAB71113.1 histidine kinase [Paenibacillus crassostreae]
MHFLLVVHEPYNTVNTNHSKTSLPDVLPEVMLKSYGYQVFTTSSEQDIPPIIEKLDAVVLHIPIGDIKGWDVFFQQQNPLPLMWWCGSGVANSSITSCEDNVTIDGILTPSMNEVELHWALHIGTKQFYDRKHWLNERSQLISRLEERKWIDMAKQILSEVNRISEAEAYDVLRKRAMNERKRMVDIATSIVKAQQQLKA